MEKNDMQAVIETAKQAAGPEFLAQDATWAASAGGGAGRVIALERFNQFPSRPRGVVTLFDVASFNRALAIHAKAGCAAVYVDREPEAPSVVAVFNDTGAEGPGWGDHRAFLKFRPTPQWSKWRAVDGKMMGQEAFAQFLEDNRGDIAEPSAADMVEIASNLSVERKIAHRSNVQLVGGAFQFEFSDNHDAKVGGAKQLAIPETFTLALAPFQGVEPFRVPARFRYRLSAERAVSMGFRLERIEDLMRTVMGDVVAKLAPPDGVPVLEGEAPAPVKPAE